MACGEVSILTRDGIDKINSLTHAEAHINDIRNDIRLPAEKLLKLGRKNDTKLVKRIRCCTDTNKLLDNGLRSFIQRRGENDAVPIKAVHACDELFKRRIVVFRRAFILLAHFVSSLNWNALIIA